MFLDACLKLKCATRIPPLLIAQSFWLYHFEHITCARTFERLRGAFGSNFGLLTPTPRVRISPLLRDITDI